MYTINLINQLLENNDNRKDKFRKPLSLFFMSAGLIIVIHYYTLNIIIYFDKVRNYQDSSQPILTMPKEVPTSPDQSSTPFYAANSYELQDYQTNLALKFSKDLLSHLKAWQNKRKTATEIVKALTKRYDTTTIIQLTAFISQLLTEYKTGQVIIHDQKLIDALVLLQNQDDFIEAVYSTAH
jgi:hypothetical protein